MVQVDRPPVLVPLVPGRSPSPCSSCPTKIWRPLSPCPTCPTTPTCPNLSHLVVPRVLYQLSFVRFFLDFSVSFHFSKNTFEWKVFSKYYHVGEGINDNQIYGKLTFSSDLSPLCQWNQKIFATWCTGVEAFRYAVYRCFRTESQQRDKQNPMHEILVTVVYCFRRVSTRRRLRTQSVNLPVLVLTLSVSRRLLTVYTSSHLVRPVLRRLCVYETFSCRKSHRYSQSPT